MSETAPQPNRPEDEQISSPASVDNLESQPIPATTTGSVVESATDPVVAETATNHVPGEKIPAVDPAEPEPTVSPESELQSLAIALTEISNQRDAFQSQYLRIAADFDNFRKRNSKEKEEIEVRTKCATIMEILSVVDNFERARNQIKPQNDGELGIHKSYQGVYKQLVESLKRVGVSPMRPEGWAPTGLK